MGKVDEEEKPKGKESESPFVQFSSFRTNLKSSKEREEKV